MYQANRGFESQQPFGPVGAGGHDQAARRAHRRRGHDGTCGVARVAAALHEEQARVRIRRGRLGQGHGGHIGVTPRLQDECATQGVRMALEPGRLLDRGVAERARHAIDDEADDLPADMRVDRGDGPQAAALYLIPARPS